MNASHANGGRVQDAYSLRCTPQVHGAAREALGFARRVFEIEAPVGIASDVVCLGIAQLATISERRCERLVNPAIASEIKTLAHPASADTIPTSGNRDDHVSMSMSAGLKAARAADLARHAIACELLCACEAIDLLAPLRSSPPLMRAHDFIRARVPAIEHDRSFSPDLRVISDMIVSGALERSCAVDVN